MFGWLWKVKPDLPSHTPGTPKGEEMVIRRGREPGRSDVPPDRTARDATAINPDQESPIDPRMPHMPPP